MERPWELAGFPRHTTFLAMTTKTRFLGFVIGDAGWHHEVL
jgi:hypothetical protein